MTNFWIPSVLVVLASLSLLVLRSVAPSLVSAQVLSFVVGTVGFIVAASQPYTFWSRWRWVWYGLLNILLLVLLVRGVTTRGIAGWLELGPLSLQPSQLAVLCVGLVIADFVTHKPPKNVWHLTQVLSLIALPLGLIVLEPDLGTAIVYVLACLSAIWVARVPIRFVLALGVIGILTVIAAWFLLLKPYQKDRISSFLNRDADTAGSSYNARQALIAVGSGEVLGRGLGQGVQSHLRFLPERQTDFVFASLAEETGFVGSTIVLGLYASICLHCIWIAQQTKQVAGGYFALITATMMLVQISINIGMNIGIFPITGITLPFLSYGGSSIVSTSFMFGVIWKLGTQPKVPAVKHLG